MACDEGLVERMRGELQDTTGIGEKRMFGGVCFTLNGNMVLSVVKDEPRTPTCAVGSRWAARLWVKCHPQSPKNIHYSNGLHDGLSTGRHPAHAGTASCPPPHVQRKPSKYLECGIFAHGFARAWCDDCGHNYFLAYSCKGRGVCPSCNTRRMVETAAHLTDHVFPRLPVRQWVLSVPKRLRYFMQRDGVFEEVAGEGDADAASGALSPGIVFHPARGIDAPAVAQVQADLRRRILRAFVGRGLLACCDAKEMLAYQHSGFSVDAGVLIEADDRAALERLLRYCARPPFAMDRLRKEGDELAPNSPFRADAPDRLHYRGHADREDPRSHRARLRPPRT